MTLASFEGRTVLEKSPFLKTDFLYFWGGGHQFWPPRTAFELKTALPTTKNQPDATALTENAINLLKLPKNIKIIF